MSLIQHPINSPEGRIGLVTDISAIPTAPAIGMVAGIILIVGIFGIQVIAVAELWLGKPVTWLSSLVGCFLATIVLARTREWPGSVQVTLWGAALAAVVVLIAIALSSAVHDFSADGQAYHQQAVIELSRGWNPFYDAPVIGSQSLPVNCYVKGPWLLESAITSSFSGIEAGKAINLILGVASFFFAWPAAVSLLPQRRAWALCIAAVAAANPVLGYQWATYYVDSQIGSLLLTLLAATVLAHRRVISTRLLLLPVIASLVMLVNIKFTGAIFASLVVLMAALGAASLYGRLVALRVAGLGTFAIVIGVLAVGWNPYMTNTLRHGHPFYPLLGHGAVDIIKDHATPDFLARNRVSKLLLSTFARTHSLMPEDQREGQVTLKIPFFVSLDELRYFFSRQDTRIGGFGPFFSGGLLTSMVCLAALLGKRASRRYFSSAVIVATALLITVLVIPEPWWARYVPQFWLFPFVLAFGGMMPNASIVAVQAARITIVVLLVNSIVVWSAAIAGVTLAEITLRAQLEHLSVLSRTHVISVQFGADSNRLRLQAANIRFSEVTELPCAEPMQIIRSASRVCVEGVRVRDSDYNPAWLRKIW